MDKIVDKEYLVMLSAKGIIERNKILEIERELIDLNRIKNEALSIIITEEIKWKNIKE